MASSDVRNIMLRALFEPDFHNQLVTDPERALTEYPLSDEERRALTNPGKEIYGLLTPASERTPALRLFGNQAPTTTTVTNTTTITVYIVVAITVFVTAIAALPSSQRPDLEAYRPLIDSIRNSSGAARMDLVKTLVNELTKEG